MAVVGFVRIAFFYVVVANRFALALFQRDLGAPVSTRTMPVRPPAGSGMLPESWVWNELATHPDEHPPQDIMFFAKVNETSYEFMHIPKTAGTAIEYAGSSVGQLWGKQSDSFHGYPRMPDGNGCSPWHLPAQTLDQIHMKNPYNDADGVFCVSRHPYNRFLSEYTYRVRIGVLGHGDQLCSQQALNKFLQKTLRMVMDGQRWIYDCHFLPQSEYIWDNTTGKQWCSDVLRFDNLPSELEVLMARWSIPVTLAAHKVNPSNKACPDLSTKNLTAETRDLIRTAYKADFELLQYDPTLLY